jgi:hypothetical protein
MFPLVHVRVCFVTVVENPIFAVFLPFFPCYQQAAFLTEKMAVKLETRDIAQRGIIEINCVHDKTYDRDTFTWNQASASKRWAMLFTPTGDKTDRTIQSGEIMFEIKKNNGGSQQPVVRSYLNGILLNQALNPGRNNDELAMKFWDMIRIIGFAKKHAAYDAIGVKENPVAVTAGLITCDNFGGFHIRHGEWLMADLPDLTNRHLVERRVLRLVPVRASTIRAEVKRMRIFDGIFDNQLMKEFFLAIYSMVYYHATVLTNGINFADANATALADTAETDLTNNLKKDGVAVRMNGKTFEVETKNTDSLNVEKAVESFIRMIRNNSQFRDFFVENTMPINAMMMSHLCSRIVGVAKSDSPNRTRVDVVPTPMIRSMVNSLY